MPGAYLLGKSEKVNEWLRVRCDTNGYLKVSPFLRTYPTDCQKIMRYDFVTNSSLTIHTVTSGEKFYMSQLFSFGTNTGSSTGEIYVRTYNSANTVIGMFGFARLNPDESYSISNNFPIPYEMEEGSYLKIEAIGSSVSVGISLYGFDLAA